MTEKVIRISIPTGMPDQFLDDLIAAIQTAIQVLTDQHYGKAVHEAEVEIAVGQLYHVKHQAEKQIARKMRRAG